jgi:acetyl-CoA acetyltransferase
MATMTDALVLGGVRTPVGRYGAALARGRTDDLLGQTMVWAVGGLGVEPLARVVASGTYALDPQVMGIAPAWAIPKAMKRAGLAPEQVDIWEVHEAFAAQALGVLRELPNQLGGFEVPDEKLNPNGCAVAIGHPFGSSGTRYVLTLATELRERGVRYGVLGVCVGSGQGVALVLENPAAA